MPACAASESSEDSEDSESSEDWDGARREPRVNKRAPARVTKAAVAAVNQEARSADVTKAAAGGRKQGSGPEGGRFRKPARREPRVNK